MPFSLTQDFSSQAARDEFVEEAENVGAWVVNPDNTHESCVVWFLLLFLGRENVVCRAVNRTNRRRAVWLGIFFFACPFFKKKYARGNCLIEGIFSVRMCMLRHLSLDMTASLL
jgi:hypothetical protein